MTEKTYSPHQKRVIEEKAALDEKLSKLAAFINTDVFINLSAQEQVMLGCQFHAMSSYSSVLSLRIIGFDSDAAI